MFNKLKFILSLLCIFSGMAWLIFAIKRFILDEPWILKSSNGFDLTILLIPIICSLLLGLIIIYFEKNKKNSKRELEKQTELLKIKVEQKELEIKLSNLEKTKIDNEGSKKDKNT